MHSSRFQLGTLALALAGLGLTFGLTACSSSNESGGGGGNLSGTTALRTLGGTVLRPGLVALPGATVTAGSASAVTDAQGNFVLVDPPAGNVHVTIDGSTAVIAGSNFTTMAYDVPVSPEGASTLPNPVTLVDLNHPNTAASDVPVDPGGDSAGPIDVANGDDTVQLLGAMGTSIDLSGIPSVGTVSLSATPVAPNEVPMPLNVQGLSVDSTTFVTIQPANASFSPALSVILPNDRDLPVGTMVDIWSFDHDVQLWVNRSTETGNQGTVTSDGVGGSFIDASNVITKGGWHAPVATIDLTCATTMEGSITDSSGNPLAGVNVITDLGQAGTTDAAGNYSIGPVPAYVAADLPTCTPIAVGISVLTPIGSGTVGGSTLVMAGSIVPAGITPVATIELVIPNTGSVAGVVRQNGAGVAGPVTITGPTNATVSSSSSGNLFASGLTPGNYRADFTFPGESTATRVNFPISQGMTTVIAIQDSAGMGSETIQVKVFYRDENDGDETLELASGASVMLVGADAGSSGGLGGITNAQGIATFANVDGPYTVTAQVDRLFEDDNDISAFGGQGGSGFFYGRIAGSIIDIDPTGSTIGVLVEVPEGNGGSGDPVDLSATLSGVVTGLPANPDSSYGAPIVIVRMLNRPNSFQFNTSVDILTGEYSLSVPATEPLFVNLIDPTGDTSTPLLGFGSIAGAILVPSVPAIAVSGMGTLNFDLAGPNYLAFNNDVPVTWNNVDPEAEYGQAILSLSAPNGAEWDFFLFDEFLGGGAPLAVGLGSSFPATVALPNLASSALSGYRREFQADFEGFPGIGTVQGKGSSYFSSCTQVLAANTSAIVVDFSGVPVMTSPDPTGFDSYTVSEAENLAVTFTEGSSTLANGINFFEFDGEVFGSSHPDGVDGIAWRVFGANGSSSLDLPPTLRTMFTEGMFLEGRLLQIDTDHSVQLNSFFNQNLDTNLDNFNASNADECEALQSVFFEIPSEL